MADGFVREVRIATVIGVIFLYCLLSVFIDEDLSYPLLVHLKYLCSLFFLRL